MSNLIAVLMCLIAIKSLDGSVPENLRTVVLVLVILAFVIDITRVAWRSHE